MNKNKKIVASLLVLALLIVVAPVYATTVTSDTIQTSTPSIQPETLILGMRSFAGLIGQRITAYLTSLRSTIGHSAGIADTQKKQLLQQLAQDISIAQTSAVSIARTNTSDELQARIDQLKTFWLQKDRQIKYYVGLIVESSVARALERFDTIGTKVDELVSRLDPKQDSTNDILKLRSDFKNEVQKAKDSYTTAHDAFAKIQQSDAPQDLFKQGNAALRVAHTHVQAARTIFKTILDKLQQTFPENVAPLPSTIAPLTP